MKPEADPSALAIELSIYSNTADMIVNFLLARKDIIILALSLFLGWFMMRSIKAATLSVNLLYFSRTLMDLAPVSVEH